MVLTIVCGVLFLLSATGATLYGVSEKNKAKHLEAEYESKLKALESSQTAGKVRIMVASREIPAGRTLQTGDVKVVDGSAALASENRIADPKQVIGKITKIDLGKNTPLISSMVFEDTAIAKDLRNQEFNVIQLPSDLEQNQFVDVRINFPTGQDYIVLAKKKVKQLSGGIVWFEMDESEILKMSSAIIDAYLQGAKLYALTYVDPGMQEPAVANYPVNAKVLDLMESDPNLLETAKNELARQLRAILDKNLQDMDDVQKLKVTNGNVTVQQQLRNNQAAAEQNKASQQTESVQTGQSEPTGRTSSPSQASDTKATTPSQDHAPDKTAGNKQQNVFEQSVGGVSP